MEEEKKNISEGRTFTQSEVEGIVSQINNSARAQCEQLAKRCQFLEEQLAYKRLDYLFMVLRRAAFFSGKFVQKCTQEIESILTIPENTEEDTNVNKDTE